MSLPSIRNSFVSTLRGGGLAVIGALWLAATAGAQSAFTPGNLAVVQAASATANNTTATVLELRPDLANPPVLVQAIAIPGTGTNAIRISGSATSTGYAANSNDRTLFAFTGANSTNTSSNANTLNPRAVVTLSPAGVASIATTYTGGSGDQTRGATTLNNTNWFIGDQGGLFTNGASSASPSGNLRSVKSFGGAVYALQASNTAANVVVGNLAAPSGATFVGLSGLTNNNNAQDFYLVSSGVNGAAFDVLYVLSATSNTAGTISKYSLVGSSWVANGAYTTAFGGFGLAAARSGASTFLYVTTGQGALSANSVLRLTDTAGYNAAISIANANNLTLYSAAAGTTLKGIAFAPFQPANTPDLTVALSAPGTASVGSDFDYTLAAANGGTGSASGIAVQFTVPANLTVQSTAGAADFTGSVSGQTVTFSGGALAAGASATLTVTVRASAAATYTAPAGAALIDPANAVAEINELNNASPFAASTVVSNPANTPPTVALAATTAAPYLTLPNVTAAAGDPTDPAATRGVDVLVGDAETPAAQLVVTATSSNPAVVPNTSAALALSGTGANRLLKITPAGVGYATITVSVSDGTNVTSATLNYAASAASAVPATSRFLFGGCDASSAIPLDANFMLVADDENQALRLYSRQNSGSPFAAFDFTANLGLTDVSGGVPREVDIEMAARAGNRIFWLGSQSNSSSFSSRPNRNRIFATDLSGSGANATLSFVGYYAHLREDLIAWDQGNGHGLGANYFGFAAGAAAGVDPKTAAGYNLEGAEFAPDGTTLYLGFRAPIVPATARTKALIVPLLNAAALVSGSPAVGPASFGPPIQFSFGGRGIREIRKNASNEYLIAAGYPGDPTGVAPYRLYTWTGNPADAPVLRSASFAATGNPGALECIVEVPSPLTATSVVQVIADNGETVFYGDGVAAKDLTVPAFKKSRSDVLVLGQASYDLSALTISEGTLSPSFTVGTAMYSAAVPNATLSITVTPAVQDPTSTIQVRVNGAAYAAVASGTASAALPLTVGMNLIEILVTAQDGSFRVHTITITRAASSVAALSALAISPGTLSPGFAPGTLDYFATVPDGTISLTVTPTAAVAGSTIRVNGVVVASGTSSDPVAISAGTSAVSVAVTAPDGVTTRTYTLATNRPPVAGSLTLRTRQDTAVSAPVSRLLAGSTDPDGDAIMLGAVAPAGSAGGTITLAGGTLTYAPPGGFTGTDSFGFTVGDGRGGSAEGTVSVTVLPATGAGSGTLNVGSVVVGPNSTQVNAFGIPGRVYVVEFTDDLGSSWTPLGSAPANTFGGISYVDESNPRPPQRFYRVRQ